MLDSSSSSSNNSSTNNNNSTILTSNPQRAVLLSAVTIAAIVGVVLIVSLTAGLEEEYTEVRTLHYTGLYEKILTILIIRMAAVMMLMIVMHPLTSAK